MIAFTPREGTIEARVMAIVKGRIADAQQKHDKKCSELFETMKFNIENEKQRYEQEKEEHAVKIVKEIIGKVL